MTFFCSCQSCFRYDIIYFCYIFVAYPLTIYSTQRYVFTICLLGFVIWNFGSLFLSDICVRVILLIIWKSWFFDSVISSVLFSKNSALLLLGSSSSVTEISLFLIYFIFYPILCHIIYFHSCLIFVWVYTWLYFALYLLLSHLFLCLRVFYFAWYHCWHWQAYLGLI